MRKISPIREWRWVLAALILMPVLQPCAQAQQPRKLSPKVLEVLNMPLLEIKEDEDPIVRIKKERFNAALKEAQARFDMYKHGLTKSPDLIEVGERLFGAQVDLYDKPEDRVRVLQQQLDVYNEAESNLEKQVKEGLAPDADLEHLRYNKASLQIELLTARKSLAPTAATPSASPSPSPEAEKPSSQEPRSQTLSVELLTPDFCLVMLLKAAINGKRSRDEHPAIPINPSQQAHQAAIAVEAGAGAIHAHPRDEKGRESLACDDVAAALQAIRAKCPTTPVGISTGAWMVPNLDARIALIAGWNVLPDFASVNFHEPGALEVFRVLADHGIALEAGIWNLDAARFFCQSDLASRCLRILIEPAQEQGNAKVRLEEIEGALQGIECPRLLHGFEAFAWEFIALAADRGYDTRVGFEDTLVLPDGNRAHDNRELVAAARQIINYPERSILNSES